MPWWSLVTFRGCSHLLPLCYDYIQLSHPIFWGKLSCDFLQGYVCVFQMVFEKRKAAQNVRRYQVNCIYKTNHAITA